MSEPLVVTVIVNTNRRNDTLACLASLRQSIYRNHIALVLDNASSDGSVQAIHSQFPEVRVIELEENRGYAGNNNVGIQNALALQADWVFVLNEDTILDPECIDRLVQVGEADSRIGIVGPMVYHYDEPNVIQSAGGIIDRYWAASHIAQNEADRGQFTQPRPVDWISGCAILVRRAVIERIGLLDERFFIYWEETEWCLRAKEAGWHVVHVPKAKIWHKGVQRDYRPGPSVTYYSTRNRFLLLAKHKAPPMAWIVAWCQNARTLLSWSLRPKWREKRQHRDSMIRGFLDYHRGRFGPAVFP